MLEHQSSIWGALAAGLCLAASSIFLLGLRSAPTTKRPSFVDVAPLSKIPYITNNSSGGRKYFPQPMCGGVAIFDFDNDGRLDIFLTNGAKLPEMKKTRPSYYNCLLQQRADGTFEDVTAKAGLLGEPWISTSASQSATTTMTAMKISSSAQRGRNTLYHNNGDGTFTDVTEASGIGTKPPGTLSVAAAWFDYDNDGLLDLIVSNYTIWTPQTDFRCTMGSAEYYCDPQTLQKRAATSLSQSGPRQV